MNTNLNTLLQNVTPEQMQAFIQLLPLLQAPQKQVKEPKKKVNNHRRQIEESWRAKYPFS